MTQQDMIADTPPVTASVTHAAGATVVPSSPASRSAPIGSEASVRHAAVWLAWALWTLTALLLIGYIALRLHWYVVATTQETTLLPYAVGLSLDAIPQVIANIFAVATSLGFPTLGALIVSRASERRIGWLYCAIGLAFAVDRFSGEYAVSALLVAPGSLPAGLVFAWIQNWSWIVAVGLLFVFLPLLYPTGRLVSRRWKPVAVFAIALVVGGVVLEAVAPGPLANHLLDFPVAIGNPLGIAALGLANAVIAPIAALLLLLLILVAAASLLLRLRRSRGDERQQLKWFAYAATLLVVVFVTFNLFGSYLPREGVTLTVKAAYNLVAPFIFACLPLLTGLAILKYRLYDIDRLINRTLVYGALTACVVGLYVLLVGGLGVLLQVQGSLPLSVLTIGLVALLVQPLRERLQRAVNRLLYGERDDPYALLTRLETVLKVIQWSWKEQASEPADAA
jgi:hypothetical protein